MKKVTKIIPEIILLCFMFVLGYVYFNMDNQNTRYLEGLRFIKEILINKLSI